MVTKTPLQSLASAIFSRRTPSWATMRVQLRWSGKSFDLDADESQPGAVFKSQVYSLTGVPPARQKIMGLPQGAMLKDETTLQEAGVKEGQKLMLVGSAEEAPAKPQQEPTFVEDITDDDTAQQLAPGKYPAGLVNMGNTCYMNATLQCLRSVPQLREAVQSYDGVEDGPSDGAHRLTAVTKELWKQMGLGHGPLTPFRQVMTLRELHPQFAERGNDGRYMQQDAEECWSQMLTCFGSKLRDEGDHEIVSQLFGVRFRMRLACEESDEERHEEHTALSLKCNINNEVNNVIEGLKVALTESRELYSEKLGRNAVFKGDSKIVSLPEYATIHMVRFFWKQSVGERAKILRAVTFSDELDLAQLCEEGVQEELEPARERRRKLQQEMKDGVDAQSSSVDRKDEHTGMYELTAILTHKGRSADSGHYVAWAKQDDGTWIEFDDDQLRFRKEEDIMNLKGGGDWHMGYMLLFRAIKC